MTMYWGDNQFKITVPIDKASNVATFGTAPGYSKFKLFCEQAQMEYDHECSEPMTCQPAEVESDDRRDSVNHGTNMEWPTVQEVGPKQVEFDIDGKSTGSMKIMHNSNLERDEMMNTSAQFLEVHQKYGHIGFNKLIEMAKQGIINSKFAKCPIPVCSACMFAKAKRKRWRDKPRKE